MTAFNGRPAADYLSDSDTVVVARTSGHGKDELFIAIAAQGMVTAFNGHVDLGTGIRTSLAQIVAEELDVPFDQVCMVLGGTSATPNQGATIASETIQVTASPLRFAAATARAYLIGLAAKRLGMAPDELTALDGVVRPKGGGNLFVSYGDLIAGDAVRLELDLQVPLKAVSEYRIVGKSQPRVDIPEKATGTWTFVHDVRLPGMLHGRVVRPPYAGFDAGAHVGTSFIALDDASVADVPGLVAVVAIGDFVGVVATREENAILAMQQLNVTWKAPPDVPDLNAPEAALRGNPSTPRQLANRGDVDLALAGTSVAMDRTYVWPYQMHGSIGPSCAVAQWQEGGLTVWSGTQNPFPMRADLAKLLDMAEDQIVVERLEAAGCYGRNCADDVTADAALLSRAVRQPVRVQLTREQEHAWEPKGAAQVIDVRGGLDLEGGPTAYDFETRYPSNLAPTLALILTGKVSPVADVTQMGDRTAIPPYAYGNLRVTVHDMPPIARASWFRGVSAMPNSFGHESFIDELATAAGVDPIEYRLRYLGDPRAIDLVRAVAERAKWVPHTGPGTHGREGDILYGRGFAYAVYVHGKFPGTAAAWAAWVADVAVNKVTGEIALTRVVCGQDTGQVINPDGVTHQIHGNILQSTSRVLKEQVTFSSTAVTSKEWGAYPLLTFPEVPDIDVLLIERPDEPPLGAGESASVPSAAAIANAVFDATGVRFRELPLTPERVRAALNPLQAPGPAPTSPIRGWRNWRLPFAAIAGAAGVIVTGMPWRPAIAPIERPGLQVFSSATIALGRLAAAAGACNVCHVGFDGTAFAGGRPLDTPFGKVYATNITPDPVAGIGSWSYPAFERAMRAGVSRDGHHLYPAHPYTSFAKVGEPEMQALYAYLMVQPAVPRNTPETKLSFPFNFRPLMAGWNALFLSSSLPATTLAHSAEWKRGADLVEGLGHCSACHSSRNALGVEKTGRAHLAGGIADGWEAPSLTADGFAPVAWSEDAFYEYLRTGRSAQHGVAAGPMAHVVDSMSALPDSDIRAMAIYLASLNAAAVSPAEASAISSRVLAATAANAKSAELAEPLGGRIFAGACASCHSESGALTSLALNTNLHSDRPDNAIQAILHGVDAANTRAAAGHAQTTTDAETAMPSFRDALDDRSLAELVRFLRARYSPGKAPWTGVDEAIARLRPIAQHF